LSAADNTPAADVVAAGSVVFAPVEDSTATFVAAGVFDKLVAPDAVNTPDPSIANPEPTLMVPDVVEDATGTLSILSLFRLSKFASTSAFVRGEPLPVLVTMVAISRPLY
jgi:hypothetical protein